MTRRALIPLLAGPVALLAPPASSAQTPSPLYAGGSVETAPPGQRDLGDSEIGIRVLRSGRVAVRAVTLLRCARGGAEVAKGGVGTLNPDGSFRAVLRRSTQIESRSFRSRSVVTGRIDGAQATGTITSTARGGAARLRGCRGSVAFVARNRPVLGNDPAPPPADAALLGMSSRTRGGPFGVNLRVSGGRVTKIVASYRSGCRQLRGVQETNYSPPASIRPDGTFVRNERFRVRYTDAVDSVRVLMRGRFVAGGAKGSFRSTIVSRSRRTGRVIDRCDTGLIRWTATPA